MMSTLSELNEASIEFVSLCSCGGFCLSQIPCKPCHKMAYFNFPKHPVICCHYTFEHNFCSNNSSGFMDCLLSCKIIQQIA